MSENAKNLLESLKKIVSTEVILSPNVQQLEYKGQAMVVEVFEILRSDPERLLPKNWHDQLKSSGEDRSISDFVAGMTDSYLMKVYERLRSPRIGSVFDNL